MSEMQTNEGQETFADLFARQQTGPVLQAGQVVKGRIIQIGADSVFVDVHGKGEAVIARAELEDDNGVLQVAVGTEIEATVLSTDGEVRSQSACAARSSSSRTPASCAAADPAAITAAPASASGTTARRTTATT